MGNPFAPSRALLLIGTLFQTDDSYYRALPALSERFGEVLLEGPRTDWGYSDYYLEEMGSPLFRRFIFFRDLVEQDCLAQIKHATNRIEQVFSAGDRRTINLDPGYLTPAKLVLASTKDYSHRVYLGQGIFGEVTLTFRKGSFTPHINTYRDYRDERSLRMFMAARKMLMLLEKDRT